MIYNRLIIGLICFFVSSIGLSAQYLNIQHKKDTLENIDKFRFNPSINIISKQVTIVKKFDSASLPLFCRIEHKIESKSKVAFRFRLGDLNYVNMLENKR